MFSVYYLNNITKTLQYPMANIVIIDWEHCNDFPESVKSVSFLD